MLVGAVQSMPTIKFTECILVFLGGFDMASNEHHGSSVGIAYGPCILVLMGSVAVDIAPLF